MLDFPKSELLREAFKFAVLQRSFGFVPAPPILSDLFPEGLNAPVTFVLIKIPIF